MKRYIYIILGIVVLAVIAIVAIFLLKQNSSLPSFFGFGSGGSLPQVGNQGNNNQQGVVSSTPNTTSTTNTPEGSFVKNFGVVSNGPVLSYFADPQNNITLIKPNGMVVSSSNNQPTTVNSSTINDIISAAFSYNGKKIVVSSGDPNNPRTNIFDVATKSWVAAPSGMQSPQWSPSDYRIAYLSQSTSGILSLSTIDAANLKKGPITLISLHAADLALQWVSKTQFILADKPSANNAGSMLVFDAQKGTLSPVVYENTGIESLWGSTGTSTLGLVFANSGQNSTLQLLTSSGSQYHALAFITLPSKCLFNTQISGAATSTTSTSYLYCGIPTDPNTLSSAQLADGYNMMSLFTIDELIRVNIASGARDVLWNDPTQSIDATDLKFFNNALFFVNRYDQKLYTLTLASSTTQ